MKNKIKYVFWLAKESLLLDFTFLAKVNLGKFEKLEFLTKKYLIILFSSFKKFKLGSSFAFLNKEKNYYDYELGIIGYQSILTRHMGMIHSAKLFALNSTPTVLDIGASVGFFSKAIKKSFPESKVYAFEPIFETFQALKKNLEKYGASLFNFALGESEGKFKMNFLPDKSVLSKFDKNGNVEVATTTLNTFFLEKNLKKINLLKIDTETFEKAVLEGSTNVLEHVESILLEVTINSNPNYTFSEIISLLYKKNVYNFQMCGYHHYKGIDKDRLGSFDILFKNILFKPE